MKNEIREQLLLLAKEIIVEENINISTVKELALEIYNRATILEFVETRIEDSLQKTTKEEEEIISVEKERHFSEEKTDEKVSETKSEEDSHPKTTSINELEVFAAEFQYMPEFERKTEEKTQKPSAKLKDSETENDKIETPVNASFQKPKSLNDTISRGLSIGLNDRLAFVNHLFEGQAEDYSRVLSQINTLNSYEEARTFIENRVKPDYNFWKDKEEISTRFMMIIEKNFS